MKVLKNDLNLEMTRGDTLSFGMEIYAIGQALDTAYFTCKNNYDDETPLFQLSIGHGITLDSYDEDGNYFYKVRIDPVDTQDLLDKKYYYDIQIGVNQDIFTIAKGILTIEYDVTGGE